MLECYKDGQPMAYSVLSNAIRNNRLSHAYLFDSSGNSDVMDIVLSFVKEIVCSDTDANEDNGIICKRIDDGNYLDVKVIEPDGLWIKKEQMVDLQEEFSKRAIEGKKKIYIIKSADRMNVQTANSILKFLEEPVDDIIAILIVDNINLVLPTIISRCQIVKLNRKNFLDTSLDNFVNLIKNTKYDSLSLEEKSKIIDDAINFVNMVEDNGIDTLIYIKKIWHNNFKDRDSCLVAFDVIINFYYDVIKYKASMEINFFKDRYDIVEKIGKKNEFSDIIRKIEILDEAKSNIKRNLNVNLLVDKMVIDMCG